jgi:hypothetical protein
VKIAFKSHQHARALIITKSVVAHPRIIIFATPTTSTRARLRTHRWLTL